MKPRMKQKETGSGAIDEAAALAHLKRVHPALYAAALPHKGAVLTRLAPKRTNAQLFSSLASSIVSQQLSTKAAASIFARLASLLGGSVTPAGILAATPGELRAVGLSAAKVASLTELSEAVVEKRLNLVSLRKLPPEEAAARLTSLRGIGPWTAEMFLIFALGAPDVFSPGDLILARQAAKHHGKKEMPSKKELALLAELWSPHRTYVSLLFWKLHHAEQEAFKKSL